MNKSVRRRKVKLLDLVPQYNAIEREIRLAMEEVLAGQQFILGPKVEELEKAVAEYCESGFGIGVASGSDAILLTLMAIGIEPQEEVITTPYTFFSTVSSIVRLGAKPVFVDIDRRTFNIDPERILERLTSRTRAVLVVHLFGQTSEMDTILEIAGKRGIPVIEDACQSIGARYKGKRAGSMGLAGCISFFPTKNLGGFGDGGMIVTGDASLAEKLRMLRVHGARERYFHDFVGINSRLDAIQAAVLLVKLKYLDAWHEARRRNASRYNERLKGVEGIEVPLEAPGNVSVYNQYVIRSRERDELRKFLLENEIGCEVYYPLPLHLQKCFASLGYREGDFPEAERAARESLALPVYPELSCEDIDYVAEKVAEFASRCRRKGSGER